MPYLGVDIGGTAVKLSIVDAGGTMLVQGEYPVNHDGYRTPILQTVLTRAQAFCQAHGIRPEGVGVSATGQVDVHRGIVAGTCGNLPGWEGTPIRQAFMDAFSVPVAVMNDVNCALLGEAWRGGAQGCTDAVMVTLGTGVGCAVLVQGHILGGRNGYAGEGGHFPTHVGGHLCTCGNRGCYEQYASVTALMRMLAQAMPDAPRDGRETFARIAAGDAQVAAVVDAWIVEIAAGLTGLVHLFNPALVLVGGGVSGQGELLMNKLRRLVLAQVMPRYGEGLQLEAATLGNNAGMLGAVRLWLDMYG